MKKATKKLFVSIVLLVLAVSFATTSTYAWFTMSTTPEVRDYNINVTTRGGLEIAVVSLGGTTPAATAYKTYVSAEEITQAINGNPDFMYEITEGGATARKALMHSTYTAATDVFNVPSGFEALDAKETMYYGFDLYFRSTNMFTLYLDVSSGKSAVTSTDVSYPAWRAFVADELFDGSSAVVQGGNLTFNAANTMRYVFAQDSTKAVWDPNAGKGYDTGTTNVALDYFNYATSQSVTETAVAYTPATPDSNSRIEVGLLAGTAVGGYYTTKVTVKFWLEGWDSEAMAPILGSAVTSKLNFYGATYVNP